MHLNLSTCDLSSPELKVVFVKTFLTDAQLLQATMCTVPVPLITTPSTEAVTPITKPSTVTPISKATTVTPDTSSLQFLFPLVLNPAITHNFETNTQLQSDESLKRSMVANMTCGEVTSNNCSLQQETNADSDDTQFSAGKLPRLYLILNNI